jgi:hypothetical protein
MKSMFLKKNLYLEYIKSSKAIKLTTWLKHEQKTWRDTSEQEDIHITNKHIRRCAASLGKCKSKPQYDITSTAPCLF